MDVFCRKLRYFVTGATGFIGRPLVRQLLAGEHEVVALARDPAKASDLAALGASMARGDVVDRETMRAPMTGSDGVFHVAGWYKLNAEDRTEGQRVNVEGTRNVLDLMEELGIRKGVYTSTLAVFGDTRGTVVDESYRKGGPWLTEYDRTKWVAHYEVAEPMMRRGLPLVIVQPGVTYGHGDPSEIGKSFRQYLRRKLRGVPRTAAYCWGHVEDIARAHLLAMEKGRTGESYIIAGEPQSDVEVFALAERITGIRAPRFRPSARFLRFLAAITRSEVLRAAPATYLGNNAKAKRELGLTHRPLEEGLRDTLSREMRDLGMTPKSN